MNDRGKQMVIETIFKLVDASPSKKDRSLYIREKFSLEITQQELDIWVKYINSTLDVLYGYAGLAIIFSTKMQVLNITLQGNISNMQRVLDIERILLDLAQNILRYY